MAVKPAPEEYSFFKDKLREPGAEEETEKKAEAAAPEAAPQKRDKSEVDNEFKEKVMVIDDSPTSLTVTAGILKKAAFSSYTHRDGASALEKLKTMTPEELADFKAIFSDIDMPKLGGIELLKEVRAMEQFKTIPFVIVTSNAERSLVQKVAALKANGYLLKPLTTEALLETVAALFPGRAANAPGLKRAK